MFSRIVKLFLSILIGLAVLIPANAAQATALTSATEDGAKANAQVSVAPKQAAKSYSPRLGLDFTNPPSGTGYNYLNNLTSNINNVPCKKGESVRFMEYHATQAVWADALIRLGTKCNVQIVGTTFRRAKSDAHYDKDWAKQFIRVQKAVGTKNGSKLTVCYYGCRRSGKTGIDHEKIYAFSHVGSVANVVMAGTGNASGDTDRGAHNGVMVTASKPLYQAVYYCTNSSTQDKDLPDCASGVDAGQHIRIDFTHKSKSWNPTLDLIKKAKCPKGWGSVIGVPQWGVTVQGYIDAMLAAKARGCRVEVLGNATTWFSGSKKFKIGSKKYDALTYLAKKGIPTWEVRKNAKGKSSGVYMHYKMVVLFKVQLDGDKAPEYTVRIGSQNATTSGLHSNDDHSEQIDTYAAAQEAMDKIRVIEKNSYRLS